MIEKLLEPEVRAYLAAHASESPARLMLKGHPDKNFPLREAVMQIESRQRAAHKIPEWLEVEGVLYPPAVSIEQCSSTATSLYKSKLLSGQKGADLSGGTGVDTLALSRHFSQFHYIEQNPRLCAIAAHNFPLLAASQIQVHEGDGMAWLQEIPGEFDGLYLDPARRDAAGRKVVLLEDCSPDVAQYQDLLLEKAAEVLIKLSPMFDLSEGLKKLRQIAAIHVVSLDNECKELLFHLRRDAQGEPLIHAVNLDKQGQGVVFSFKRSEEQAAEVEFGLPEAYLYEPNAALMKAGAFKVLGERLGLKKLHANSHLYTSSVLVRDFPGRAFRILDSYGLRDQALKKLAGGSINLSLRNYPEDIHSLKKRLKIKDGGSNYLFGTTLMNDKTAFLLCEKVQQADEQP